MSPHSKRPLSDERQNLGVGGFEGISYPPGASRARAPAFHRTMTPPGAAPHGYSMRGGNAYPAHYAPAPAAPGSLSPMAMSALGTGPQAAQPVEVRSHPTVRTGMAILVAGTLIGGLFGITMRARQSAADAGVAMQERAREQHAATLAQPLAAAPLPAPAAPPQVAAVPFGSLVVSAPPTLPAGHAPSPAAAPPSAKVAQRHVGSSVKPASRPAVVAKVAKDDGYRVASAGSDEPKETKPAIREPKPAAKEPKEAKKAEAPASPAPKSDDAERVLKAAMGATENTL